VLDTVGLWVIRGVVLSTCHIKRVQQMPLVKHHNTHVGCILLNSVDSELIHNVYHTTTVGYLDRNGDRAEQYQYEEGCH
jgi:hypothetical protein